LGSYQIFPSEGTVKQGSRGVGKHQTMDSLMAHVRPLQQPVQEHMQKGYLTKARIKD